MQKIKVAHVKEQGQEMIIIPLDSSFDRKVHSEKMEIEQHFQYAAKEAGLSGTVVLIWQSNQYTKFIAPREWHPFFKSEGIFEMVMFNLNRELIIN
jgi:hypothetical protein